MFCKLSENVDKDIDFKQITIDKSDIFDLNNKKLFFTTGFIKSENCSMFYKKEFKTSKLSFSHTKLRSSLSKVIDEISMKVPAATNYVFSDNQEINFKFDNEYKKIFLIKDHEKKQIFISNMVLKKAITEGMCDFLFSVKINNFDNKQSLTLKLHNVSILYNDELSYLDSSAQIKDSDKKITKALAK